MNFFGRYCTLFIALAAFNCQAVSQSLTDTLYLDDILIEAARVPEPRKHQPVQVLIIDSLQMALSGQASLTQILENHSGLFIRNYGPAGVSTISQRGMPANQTQIYWKGFNLNHPMLGLVDLNTIPASILSGIEIQSSGSSMYGSGNIGGSVQLDTDESYRGAEISQSAGSFGRYAASARAGASTDNWTINLQALLDHSENDFSYRDRTRNPAQFRLRNNNRVETRGIIANGTRYFQNSQFNSGVWYNRSERGVPGPMQSLTPRANQEDEFIRWYGDYQVRIGGVQTGLKAYINRQELNYIDPQNNISSMSTNTSGLIDIPVRYRVTNNIHINGLAAASQTSVKSTAYNNSDRSRDHYSFRINPFIRPVGRLRLFPSLRFDKYSDFGNAVSYAFGANFAVIPDNLYWRVYAGSDFNAPTFNDLFWPESGNPELQPEEGWKAETGFYSTITGSRILQQTDAQVFMGRLLNGIQWLPGNGGNFSPQNVREIHSHGFEIHSGTTYLRDVFHIRISQLFGGTWSAYGKPRFPGDQAAGNQLVHIPRWQYRLSVSLLSGTVKAMASYRYTGERFTDENNQSLIGAYSTLDLLISYHLEYRGIMSGIRWNINNLLDSDYEVIPFYPLPGRNHLVTITLRI